MEDLIILGAGGSSQQIVDAIVDINQQKPTWNVIGYLDDDREKRGQTVNGVKVLGPVSAAKQYLGRVIVGMASPKEPGRRRRIVGELGLPIERYATVIHPSAYISPHSRLGRGSAILQNVVITQNTRLGNHVIALHNVSIGHDVTIEDFVTIAAGAVITGLSVIRAGAYIGAKSAVNNGITVNEGALVGLGAVVVKDVRPGATVVGNPAKPLAPRAT
jgi:sugar O-acyltransferase (sialic acid O-acetyltransferase NeuD family)